MIKSCYIIGYVDKLTYRQRDSLFQKLYIELEKLILEACMEFVIGSEGLYSMIVRMALVSLKMRYSHITITDKGEC